MAKKKSSTTSKKRSRSKRSGAGCSCAKIRRETGGSPGTWTQCRKKGRFVRMEKPKGKGIVCDTYKHEGKTYRRCFKSTTNKLTGRHNYVPVPMNKKCA